MRKLLVAGFLLCSCFVNAQLTAIKCGKLIDGKNDQPLLNKAILIEGNMIKDIVDQSAIPRNATIIDLNNKTVLPGLIDCHTHVLLQGDITSEDYNEQLLKESIPYRTLRASVACKIALMNGFTTIRDLETEGAMYADVDLKKAINNNVIPGPRMFVSTRAINTTGHYAIGNSEYSWELHMPKGIQEITGADEARRAVREQISYGADWIKIYADRSYYRLPDSSYRSRPNFTKEEIDAIADETIRSGKFLASHAVTRDGIIYSLNAGARTIEHGFAMDDECMDLMIKKNAYWCPTATVIDYVAEGRARAGNPINAQMLRTLPAVFKKALQKGVKIAFGTDVGGFDWQKVPQAREFSFYVQWGMTPMQAIKSATTVAAELLNKTGVLGEISKGAMADIIAVDGDPLQDIKLLEKVSFVMKDGKVVAR
ncbi:MAG TPA: amidohydrolase family protein [Chitinophagaceae bacterium]|nr:amidohydrolase family protein [Chitinophagaceae bacterium]